jgi:hypothetical protein
METSPINQVTKHQVTNKVDTIRVPPTRQANINKGITGIKARVITIISLVRSHYSLLLFGNQ